MRHYRLAVPMCFIHNRAHLVHRHLVLVDQLDDVDAGVGDLLHLRAAIVRAFDAPAVGLGVGIRLVLNERAGDVERGAWDLPLVDPVADVDTRFEWPAEIAGGGDPGHQQLLRGGRHDHRLELREVGLVPVIVIGVANDHRVDVHIPQAGQHGHAFRGDHLSAGRHRKRPDLADRGDLVSVDQDHAVLDRWPGEAVDERAADERLQSGGGRRSSLLARGQGGTGDQGEDKAASHQAHGTSCAQFYQKSLPR